jgi:hypothetical protein
VSFQRPVNNKKRKVSAAGGQDSWGGLFLDSSFEQTKEEVYKI